jgi:4-alpha-glucanotransferase
MAEERMLRSWVLEFTTTPEAPLPEPPEHCVASWGTHDGPRFAAFYRGAAPGGPNRPEDLVAEPDATAGDERARWRAALKAELTGRGLDGVVHEAVASRQPPTERAALAGCLAYLARSRATLVVVDLADLWGEVEQENQPGTGVEAGNWRHRAALSLEEARADAGVTELLDLVGRARSDNTFAQVDRR